MENKNKNLIVTLADNNYADTAKQLFSSLYFNSGWEGDYLLITDDGLKAETKAWFEEKGIIVYSPPLIETDSFKYQERKFPPLLLSEFYLFTDYFKKWDKIIFLDSDIIVTASLNPLLNLTGFNALKIANFCLRNEFSQDKQLLEKTQLTKNYNLSAPAFNSGVFVFDTSIIKPDTLDTLIALYRRYKTIGLYGDEPILNLYFYQNWSEIPVSYNLDPNYIREYYGLKPEQNVAAVIHCGWSKKPWDEASPYYPLWLENLKKADKIDLSNRLSATKEISAEEIKKFNRRLKRNHWPRRIYLLLDRQIGRLGKIINKYFPKLYKLIKPNNGKQS